VETGVATIMPDKFLNVYDKIGPGRRNHRPRSAVNMSDFFNNSDIAGLAIPATNPKRHSVGMIRS
jgi:hypothetical protein